MRLLVALHRNRQRRIFFRVVRESRGKLRAVRSQRVDRADHLRTTVAEQHQRPFVNVVVDEDDTRFRRLHNPSQFHLGIEHFPFDKHLLLRRERRTDEREISP